MNLVAQRLALKVQFETRRRLVWRAGGGVVSTGSSESRFVEQRRRRGVQSRGDEVFVHEL